MNMTITGAVNITSYNRDVLFNPCMSLQNPQSDPQTNPTQNQADKPRS